MKNQSFTRREFLKTVGVSIPLASVMSTMMKCAGSTKRPNIILIMADDLGYECLSCNGGISYQTPSLDLLAESGVRFTSCYSTPLCTPSRVQLMTGKYNQRNYEEFGMLPKGEQTFAHLFKEESYRTAVAG